MTLSFKPHTALLSILFVFCSLGFYAQDKAGEKKEEDEFAKKKPETKLTEVITTDSLPASELLQRAVNWIKVESNMYKKGTGSTNGNKAECVVSFPVKPKELNPEVDYTGKITMKVVIDCKDAKYKYTVSEIKHTSKSGNTTGGSIDNTVPECGSMAMKDLVWKKLKGEALRGAAQVVFDLKDGMIKPSTDVPASDW